jgi:hypothetical protein
MNSVMAEDEERKKKKKKGERMVMMVRKDNQPLLHFHGKTLLKAKPYLVRKSKRLSIFPFRAVCSETPPWYVQKLSVRLESSSNDGFT